MNAKNSEWIRMNVFNSRKIKQTATWQKNVWKKREKLKYVLEKTVEIMILNS